MAQQDKDLTFYKYVDPTNVNFKEGGGFITTKDKKATAQVLSPPMRIMWPKVSHEGSLGVEFTTAGGKKIRETDRMKCKLSFQLSMGCAGDDEKVLEIQPDLLEEQAAWFKLLYDMGNNALGAVYDACPDDFARYVNNAKQEVLDYELQLHQDQGKTDWKTVEDLEAAMSKDSELNDRIKKKQRQKFIDKASYKFPNPDSYDDKGNTKKAGANGKTKSIMIGFNRKRWRVKKEWQNTKLAGHVPSFDEMPAKTIEQYIALLRKMETHYQSAFFTYIDGATGKEIERPKVKNPYYHPKLDANGNEEPSDKLSEQKEIEDPFWSPFEGRDSLVQVRLFLSVFTTDTGYGIKTVPAQALTIVRQTVVKKTEQMYGISSALATGVVEESATEKREREDEEHEAAAAGDGEPVAKKPKPGPPGPPTDEELMAMLE